MNERFKLQLLRAAPVGKEYYKKYDTVKIITSSCSIILLPDSATSFYNGIFWIVFTFYI
jgi:hypothetical protein